MRNLLIKQFEELNVGRLEEIDDLTDEEIESLVEDLYEAQELGELNLETAQGIERLKEIVNTYI